MPAASVGCNVANSSCTQTGPTTAKGSLPTVCAFVEELRPYGVSMGLLFPFADMDPSDRIVTSVILTGEFTEDKVSPDVLAVDSWTGSSTLNGAPATTGRLFRAVAVDVGGSDEFRERDPLTDRNGW